MNRRSSKSYRRPAARVSAPPKSLLLDSLMLGDHPLILLGKLKSVTFKMAMQWDMRPLRRQEASVKASPERPTSLQPPPPRLLQL